MLGTQFSIHLSFSQVQWCLSLNFCGRKKGPEIYVLSYIELAICNDLYLGVSCYDGWKQIAITDVRAAWVLILPSLSSRSSRGPVSTYLLVSRGFVMFHLALKTHIFVYHLLHPFQNYSECSKSQITTLEFEEGV